MLAQRTRVSPVSHSRRWESTARTGMGAARSASSALPALAGLWHGPPWGEAVSFSGTTPDPHPRSQYEHRQATSTKTAGGGGQAPNRGPGRGGDRTPAPLRRLLLAGKGSPLPPDPPARPGPARPAPTRPQPAAEGASPPTGLRGKGRGAPARPGSPLPPSAGARGAAERSILNAAPCGGVKTQHEPSPPTPGGRPELSPPEHTPASQTGRTLEPSGTAPSQRG